MRVIIHLIHEAWVLAKRGRCAMFLLGAPCAALLGSVLLLQQTVPMPVWMLLILYSAFLGPHTIMLVALIREMLFDLMKEHFLATLKWRPHHTNFLYDSLFFLGVGALILFSAEAILLFSEEYAEAKALLEEREASDIAYAQGVRDAFAQLFHTGILAILGITGALFFVLMLVWAQNIIQMPATALGFRIRKEEARIMMHGHVFLVAIITMTYNGLIVLFAIGIKFLLEKWIPIQYYTATIVALTYWVAVYANAAFWCSIFRIFTEEYNLRSDFKGS